MGLTVTTPASSEPLSLAEAKLHLRVDGTDEDELIESLIVAARDYCETKTNRQFCTTTFKMSLDSFPSEVSGEGARAYEIRVPRPPLQSVASVVYWNLSGSTVALSGATYNVDTQSEPGRIVPAYGQYWPANLPRANAVEVNFVAGYSYIPDGIKAAMKLVVGHLFNVRDAGDGTLPVAVDSLLAVYAIPEVH